MMNGTSPATEADVAMLKQLYEAEVRWVDHQLGVLFERLEEQGIADDTVTCRQRVTRGHWPTAGLWAAAAAGAPTSPSRGLSFSQA